MLGARYVKSILLPALQYKNKLRKRSELEPINRPSSTQLVGWGWSLELKGARMDHEL